MKNYLKTYIKKTVAIFLTMIMLLTCWVWVAPDKASAATYASGQYYYKVVYENTDDQDDSDVTFYVRLYYITNNGTGSETYTTLWEGYSASDNDRDTGWLALPAGQFPSYISLYHRRNQGSVTRSYGSTTTIYINNRASDDGAVSKSASGYNNSSTCNVQYTTEAFARPSFSSTAWTSNPNKNSLSPTTSSAPSSSAELRGYDQYGVLLPGSSAYSLSAKCPNSSGKQVSSSTAYINNSGATSVSAQASSVRIYGKAITDEAVLNGQTEYTMTVTGTFTPSISALGGAKTNGTKPVITVKQPTIGNVIYMAQSSNTTNHGVITPTEAQTAEGVVSTANYGRPSGNVRATIGTSSSLTVSGLYYYWDLNRGTIPSLIAGDETYISRTGYEFSNFSTSETSTTPGAAYLTDDNGTMHIDDTAVYNDGITVSFSTRVYYGWWTPTVKTVTFVNADGNVLFSNVKQPYDHQAYYGGDTPTYSGGGQTFSSFTFAGWINTRTGELIPGCGTPGALLTNQYIYEDTTYMAYYTATTATNYTVSFDYDGDGVIESADGDFTDNTGNAYYDKVHRVTDVPSLTGEVFDTGAYLKWVDAGIYPANDTCAVEYDENKVTVTSLSGTDAYTAFSSVSYPCDAGEYTLELDADANLAGGGSYEVIFDLYNSSNQHFDYKNAVFTASGTQSATVVFPAGTKSFKIRIDANNAGNVVTLSNIRLYKAGTDYSKPATAEVDYSDPIWVNVADGSKLTAKTRLLTASQSYKVSFTESPVYYSLTLVTGSSNSNVTSTGGGLYNANTTGSSLGVFEENDVYKWSDTITLPNPGDFADGEYNYEFQHWVDSEGQTRDAGYTLTKATGVTAADGIYSDEYIRSDGLNEEGGKDTMQYYAVYRRTSKVYTVNFINEDGTPYDGYQWSGEYLTVLSDVTAPADPAKTDVDNNPVRYTYEFVGWDNTKTVAVENLSASDIAAYYDNNGVSADATYKPVFEGTYHYYVTYLNYDHSTVSYTPVTEWYTYGQVIQESELPENCGATLATPESTQVYTYALSGWATAVGARLVPGTTTVTSDITYVAQLETAYQEYDVYFYQDDGTTLIDTISDVTYGSHAYDEGTVPTATKAQTNEHVYDFIGWDDMSTPGIIENLASDKLAVVHGDQSYRAVYQQNKRPYSVSFMVPESNGVTYTTTGTPSINVTNYTSYTWTDSGVDFGPSNLPSFYYGERVTAPTVDPDLSALDAGFTSVTGFDVVFSGWYTEPNGQGTQLSRSTRIAEGSETTYYAYFTYVGQEFSVQFYESTTAATPFYTITEVTHGTDVTATAADAAAMLTPYYEGANHYFFNKWVLSNGMTAASDLANVTGTLMVYATYTEAAHDFDTWVVTTPATYFSAGVETHTCRVCGCTETRAIERLKDTFAPTGQIVIKEDDTSTVELAASNSFISDYDSDANTIYVPYDSVDVLINTADVGVGVDRLYYAISADTDAYTLADAQAYNWDQAVADGNATMAEIRNAHFTLDGEDGHSYIIYVCAVDNAVTWNSGDVDANGEPTSTTDSPNYTYLSSYKVVFDIDTPEITVTNDEDECNADNTVFCGSAIISIADNFLRSVEITKDGAAYINNSVTSDYLLSITDAGVYVVTATDVTGKTATYTFTVNADHDYDLDNDGEDDYIYTEPTCTENGYRTYTCEVCGKTRVVEDDPATILGHDYDQNGDNTVNDDDYVILTAATCDTAGEKAYVCKRCGEVLESSRTAIPALGHDYQVSKRVEPTCTEDGYVTYVCANDSAHFYTETLTATGHNWDAGVYTAATCEEGGYTTFTCTVCSETKKEYDGTAALGHDWDDGTVVYEPNCTHSGIKKYTCQNDPEHVRYESIPATGHTYEWVTTVYPTCCTTGLESFVCTDCGTKDPNTADRVLPTTDHEYGDWIETVAPTCETAGSRTKYCKNYAACGSSVTEELEALGHSWVAGEVVAPTATEQGYTVYTCSRCGATKHDDFTPALAAYQITLYDDDGTTQVGGFGTTGGNTVTAADLGNGPEKTGYEFVKWVNMDGSDIEYPVVVSGDLSFKAVYSVNVYTVTWVDGDGNTIKTDNADYGTTPLYDGAEPTKTEDAHYTYTFAGWATTADAAVEDVLAAFPAVTGNVTYYAVFNAVGREYAISWYDWSGNLLTTTTEVYGAEPAIPAVTVSGTEDEYNNYTWDGGWTPQVRLVTGDASYTATYETIPKLASIYFFAEGADTTDLSNAYLTQTYRVGETFVLPEGPAKAATDQYTYTFAGWVAVEGQTATAPSSTVIKSNDGYMYIATYTANPINYSVTFNNDDGTVISTSAALYGDAITAPATPTKDVPAEDAGKYTYEFAGWKYRGVTYAADALPTVSGDMTFTAVFEKVYNTFEITFKSYDGSTTYNTITVNYGDAISYSGATPYIARTAQFSYTWIGWATEAESDTAVESLGTATADATFYAAFTKTLRKYDITFNVDGTSVVRELEYGSAVVYPAGEEGVPSLDKAPTAYRTYTFEGWSTTKNAAVAEFAPDADLPTVSGKVTYYAVYSSVINQLTATWVNEDGTPLDAETIDYGTVPTYDGETPAKATDDGVEGANYTYKFTGWLDQNGKTYAADARFDRIVENMTFTAQFEKTYKSYTVTFTNGTEQIATADYKYGDALTVPAAPADYDADSIHYTFAGWAVSGTTTVVDLTAAAVTANVDYVAVFNETPFDTFTVTFYNGDAVYEAKDYITAEAVSAPAVNPTKASDAAGGEAEYYYRFLGWSTDETAENIITDWSGITAMADVSYYAVYETVYPEYMVKFMTDEGDFISGTNYRYGATVAVAADQTKAPTNDLVYTFAGWATSKGGEALAAIPDVTADATYYAVFTTATRYYTVTFVDWDGTVISENTDYTYGSALAKPADPTRAEDEANTYTFKNWSPAVPSRVTKSATYTAVYTAVAKTFNVFFYDVNTDGTLITPAYAYQTYTYGESFAAPANPSRADTAEFDYTFLGWALSNDATNTVITDLPATITVGASYKAVYSTATKTYTVTFKSYDGSTLDSQTVNYGAVVASVPAAPVKPSNDSYTYTFLGWNNGSAVLSADEIIAAAVTGNVTYTAAFETVYREFNVTFYDEDGATVISSKSDYYYNDPVTAPANPTKTVEGETWTFVGWTNDGGTTIYAPTGIPTVTADASYTAVYTGGVNKYTVNFYVNGTTYTNVYSHGDTLDMSAIVTDKAPDGYYNYTFAGWSATENGTVDASLPVATVKASANYYAIYTKEAITYTVKWVVDGVETDEDYLYNATIRLPAEPTKDGVAGNYVYNFLGWSTVEDSAADIVSLYNVKVKADTTYYAVFEIEYLEYDVSFRYADTNRLISTATYKYGDSLAAVPAASRAAVYDEVNYKKTEYTFLGWATASGATAAVYATSADLPAVTADVTYYAVLEATVSDYTPEYTVTFMNGTSVYATATVAKGNSPTLAGTPTRASTDTRHYAFDGWTASEIGSGTVYTNATLPAVYEDTVYYAKYTGAGHNYVLKADESYACSTSDTGLEVYYCSVCGHRLEKTVAAVHSYVLQPAYCSAPTYRNNGTNYYRCSVCGLTKSETVERLGMPVTFNVTDESGNAVPGATVTVYHEGAAIDVSTTDSNGYVTVYVPKGGGTFNVVIDASNYKTSSGTITVDKDGNVKKDFKPLAALYCKCTCHKNTLWSKIYRFLYKILYAIFRATCCDCQTYLGR